MAYWFEFSKNGWTITLNKTHDWMHLWKQILRLNGVDITMLSWTQVDQILQDIAKRKQVVTFILDSWESVNFSHNSIPDSIWMSEPSIPGQRPEWTSYSRGMEVSWDGKVIVAGRWKPWTQALKDTFPH